MLRAFLSQRFTFQKLVMDLLSSSFLLNCNLFITLSRSFQSLQEATVLDFLRCSFVKKKKKKENPRLMFNDKKVRSSSKYQ